MNLLSSLIFGLVEGLTEFLPVSSTFHLIVTGRILGLADTEYLKLYEVVIQGGAILALLFVYTKTILKDKKLLVNVMSSFLPTAVIGFGLHKIIKNVFFETDWLMLLAFISVGITFLLLERFFKSKSAYLQKSCEQLTLRDALLIGLAQSLAVIPGVSRSGSVIVTMMLLHYRRDEAAKYTFLLSMPTIISASLLDLYQGREMLMNMTDGWYFLAIGSISSFIIAYFVMKWLIGYLSRHTLSVFGWYRLALATVLIAFKVIP